MKTKCKSTEVGVRLIALLLSPLFLLTISSCSSTAPVTKSAMGIQAVTSEQLIFHRVDVVGEELVVEGVLFSPLNTINKTSVRGFGKTARIKMTQAMLRADGRPEFRIVVPIPPKVETVTIGKDNKPIWSRTSGVLVSTSDVDSQTDRAAADLNRRVNRVLDAFD